MKQQYQPIFQSFVLPSGVELKNRVLMAPMTNSSSNEKGEVTPEELAYYRARSGGVGAVITACANVLPGGQVFKTAIGADQDTQIPGLKKLAETIKVDGAKAILQLFHAGRIGDPEHSEDGELLSASAVAAERDGAAIPREMTETEIQRMIEAFGEATRRAIEAGFDGIEIHGANGYLVQQFLSPHSNRRTDQWGGTPEKRMAFPLAVINSVKKAIAAYAKTPFVIGYRFSPEEKEETGYDVAYMLQFVDVLAEQNLDYLHVSLREFWQGSFREEQDTEPTIALVQNLVGSRVPVMGVGGLSSPQEVVAALDTGVPLLSLGHALVMEPQWVEKVANGEEAEIRTTLPRADQRELAIPDRFMKDLGKFPGWFPIV
ncbi:NADH-dependent flavin oxidoreductase [Paenibacillus paridis]|uniref:NADH-dependent flavin oxidoreductase n=1 Tax=Paenibacillus paridis TaxID=2583376 RepID=UPI0011211175|nr:NADH-dependent flavin oxidoreductase [Paenibacillus paridis]